MLAPFDHQRCATALALLVRGLFHPLDVFHMLFGIFEILLKFLVELCKRVGPLLLAFFDFVEFFFQPRGIGHVEDIAEVFHQQIRHHQPNFGRSKLPPQLLHVLPLLDRRQNRRVG